MTKFSDRDGEEKRVEEWQDKFLSDVSCVRTGLWSVLLSGLSHHPEQQCLGNEWMACWMMEEQADTIHQNGPDQGQRGGKGKEAEVSTEGHSPEQKGEI